MGFSIRCTLQAFSWRFVLVRWRPTQSSKGWRAATFQRLSLASGPPRSTRGWNGCGGLSASSTMGFSFGRFVRKHPHFKGHLTDLLIGDLFKDSVDEVVEPMNVLREEMKQMAKM